MNNETKLKIVSRNDATTVGVVKIKNIPPTKRTIKLNSKFFFEWVELCKNRYSKSSDIYLTFWAGVKTRTTPTGAELILCRDDSQSILACAIAGTDSWREEVKENETRKNKV